MFQPFAERLLQRALAGGVGSGQRVQDAPGSDGAGPGLLLPWPAALPGTHPAVPLGHLLPYLPQGAVPLPGPGQWEWRPPQADEGKVSTVSETLQGFVG